MEFDSTFWVAVSFIIFLGVLIYFKIPRKINEALDTKIAEIKNELDESEKLRIETKKLLEDSPSSNEFPIFFLNIVLSHKLKLL